MRLKTIKLQNIRSYLNQTVEFPDGSTLLVGDVGSGKSTILLAVEFALFGIMAGTLSGNALLRNGKQEGSVEVRLDVEGKDIIIRRTLKRSKERVSQQVGYIVIDDVKQELTPVELKSEILLLLGYPRELVSKSKNMMYRYTVYTPQEAMKQILSEDKEVRLDTLRRVFGIDKYKRIRENAVVYARELKLKGRNLEGKIFDLPDKESRQRELQGELTESQERLTDAKPKLEEARRKVKSYKQKMESIEGQVKELHELKSQLEVKDSLLRSKVEERQRISKDIESLEEQQQEKYRAPSVDVEQLKKLHLERQEALKKCETRVQDHVSSLSALESEIQGAKRLQEQVQKLDVCPICRQDVGNKHKDDIHRREERRIQELSQKAERARSELEREKKSLINLKTELDALARSLHEHQLYELKRKSYEDRAKRVEDSELRRKELKKEIGAINSEKLVLQENLAGLKEKEKEYGTVRDDVERLSIEERELSMAFARLEKDLESVRQQLKLVEGEIEQRLKSKKQLESVREFRQWLEEVFLNVVNLMEKQVLARVYNEFNDLFRQWFSMLVEDQMVSVRLDDEFTPAVEQNGYEVEIDHLSGGEKTSCSLAYRLALNRVINDVVSAIKTKDLIILDEPTDGFSSEQLDKVRDVLEELSIQQVIIVSHEHAMESFVENIMRVSKDEHVSEVST
jgi:exonuclease SbcC